MRKQKAGLLDAVRKMYSAGVSEEMIAERLGLETRSVIDLVARECLDAARTMAAAQAKAERIESDEKFRALADAIRAMAVGVASKSKSAGVKASDVLDLAKAVEIAQRIRERARG